MLTLGNTCNIIKNANELHLVVLIYRKDEVKFMKNKLIILLSVMIIIVVLGVVITNLNNADIKSIDKREEPSIQVVTSFYPTYITALNVVNDSPEFNVKSLASYGTGCLHDYQLTAEDMKALANADIFIMNGGGMESFIEDVIKSFPHLYVINASEGINMMYMDGHDHDHENGESNEHHHDHEHEEAEASDDHHHDHDHEEAEDSNEHHHDHEHEEAEDSAEHHHDHEHEEAEDSKDHDHDHDHEEVSEDRDHDHDDIHDNESVNSHVWLDPTLYVLQIENIKNGLFDYINNMEKTNAELVQVLEENSQSYMEKVLELNNELYFNLTTNEGVVIFHDAFAYLANRIGLKIAHTIEIDSDTTLSAGEIADIINIVREEGVRFLFTEAQFGISIAQRIESETDATVYVIDSAVTGDGTKDSYLNAMQNNLKVLKEAFQ